MNKIYHCPGCGAHFLPIHNAVIKCDACGGKITAKIEGSGRLMMHIEHKAQPSVILRRERKLDVPLIARPVQSSFHLEDRGPRPVLHQRPGTSRDSDLFRTTLGKREQLFSNGTLRRTPTNSAMENGFSTGIVSAMLIGGSIVIYVASNGLEVTSEIYVAAGLFTVIISTVLGFFVFALTKPEKQVSTDISKKQS